METFLKHFSTPTSFFRTPSTLILSNPNNALLKSSSSSDTPNLLRKSSRIPSIVPSMHFSTFNPSSVRNSSITYSPLMKIPNQKRHLQQCRSVSSDEGVPEDVKNNKNGGGGGDWVTSILLFGLWVALLYYIFLLSPNQTPARDAYFLRKLLNLKGEDGFRMNPVLVSLWYIMGLWPLIYSMLLVPTGRSSKSKIPVWPFLVLSCFGGAYALIPYFVLWKPPAPAIEKSEAERWPLKFLESKIIAVTLLVGGVLLIINAGVAGEDNWLEFLQYFTESKFIHATCIDFLTLSSLAPFWVYNDMTFRNWLNKGSWLLPLALVPYLGPTLYLILRPPLPISEVSKTD